MAEKEKRESKEERLRQMAEEAQERAHDLKIDEYDPEKRQLIVDSIGAFLDSAAGDGADDYMLNHWDADKLLQDVIDRKLPTYEYAKEQQKALNKAAVAFIYIAVSIGERTTEEVNSIIQSMYTDMAALKDSVEEYHKFAEQLQDLLPELKKELKRPEYEGKDINALYTDHLQQLRRPDYDALERPSLLDIALHRAQASRAKKDEKANLPQIKAKAVSNYPVTLDKISTMAAFDWLRDADVDGQISMLPLKMESRKSKEPLTAYYSMRFSDDLPPEIMRKLLPFDRLVYFAAAAEQKRNGDLMSIRQIHRAMGNKGDPSPNQIQKIHDSIVKMNAALVSIDCSEERRAYNNDAYIDYYGSLFPMEMKRAWINGQLVESAVHILRPKLPLISIAEGRNYQLEEVPIDLFNSRLNKTDSNIAMQFFTLEQLCRLKNGTRGIRNKILYSTIYQKMGAKTDKQQQRAKGYFLKFLDELKEKGFIRNWKEETTASTGEVGVKFEYDTKEQTPAIKKRAKTKALR